jgi:hypothetical protein
MPTLAEIRQQYPQYSDLDDNVLADALHRRFYADMPREEFNKRVGVQLTQQRMGTLETAADVAKSAGIGVAQGAIGLATLPGNLEQLGRMGINAVGNLTGAEGNVVDPETFLPNYGGVKRGIEQKFTGEFYQPQTTAGEYARTIGEFAPAAIGGSVSMAGRTARVAAPAIASETAGQLTEGTALEPWARVGGALAAGHISNAGQRAVTPLPTDPVRQQAVQNLQREGVTALTAGQRTGRRPLQWTESTLSDIPFAGRRANAIQSQQADQYTRAALRRIGMNADRADPQTMATAYRQIGDRFNTVAGRNNLVPTRYFMNRLQTIGDNYRNVTAEPLRAPIVDEVITALRDPAIRQNNVIPGRLYQNYRSGLGRAAQGIQSRDPVAANAIRDIIDVLDRTMETSIRAFQGNHAADLGAFRQARNQYRQYLAIEEAVSRAGPGVEGIVTPAALRSALKRQGKRAYVHGRGDLNELARAGDLVMRPLPQSGTTPRAVAAGLIGGLSLTDPSFITSAVAPVVSGRVLMSEPVQRYLANQALNPAATALPQINAPTRGVLALPGAIEEERAVGR